MGDTAFASSEFNGAIRHYTAALEQQSTLPLLYTKRAAAYMSLRSLSQALRDLNKAVELDTGFVQGYLNRGKLQRQMCSFDAAELDFSRVLEIKPGQKVADQELKRTQAARGKLEALEAAAESALAGERHTGGGADLNAATRSLAAVRPIIDALYEDAPDCVKAQIVEARLLFAATQHEQVVAVTGRLLKTDERQLQALVLRGRAYFYLADHDMAKRHFGEALKYDPDYEEARVYFNKVKEYDRKRSRADRALEAQDWADAEVNFIQALHVDPDHRRGNEALWFGLCRARAAVGRHDDAATDCANVLILTPGHRGAKLQLVRSLMEAGRLDEAQLKSREFLQQNQHDGEFHELAREAERRLKVSKRKDYYKVLAVEPSANDRDIKRAYREMAKKHHPDKVPLDERPAAELQFREIAEAYEVLSDETKRQLYDSGQDLEEHEQRQQHQQHQQQGFFRQGGAQYTFHFG